MEEKGELCVLFLFNIIVTLSSFYLVRIVLIEREKKSCCAGAINPSIKSVSFPFSSIDIHTLHNDHHHHQQQLVILASSFFLFLSFVVVVVVVADGVERNQASTND